MAESFKGMNNPRNVSYDNLLLMKDAGLVAASGAAQVASAAKILDAGAGQILKGDMVIDISAIEVATGDEMYDIILEGSSSATFASGIVPLATAKVGAALANVRSSADGTGRVVVPFSNERMGTTYRYLRVYTVVAGTIATGINYTAFLSK